MTRTVRWCGMVVLATLALLSAVDAVVAICRVEAWTALWFTGAAIVSWDAARRIDQDLDR